MSGAPLQVREQTTLDGWLRLEHGAKWRPVPGTILPVIDGHDLEGGFSLTASRDLTCDPVLTIQQDRDGVYLEFTDDSSAAPIDLACAETSFEQRVAALRNRLNVVEGEPLFDERLDLNGDGIIDVLDIHALRRGIDPEFEMMEQTTGGGEIILAQEEVTLIGAGESTSVLLKLFNNETPLFGYSLALRAVPLGDATGSVTVNVPSTNFFEPQHLILADPQGAPLDTFFSLIQPWLDDGVFVNANTEVGQSVLAGIGVNDALAEVVLVASPDASGVFEMQLGPVTVLSDPNGLAVPFVFCGGRIAVDQVIDRPSDLNGDGVVNVFDLLILLENWGTCP